MLRLNELSVMARTMLMTMLMLGVSLVATAEAVAQVVVADAGEDLVLECAASGGNPTTLDGLGSTVDGAPAALDPDVAFDWTAPGITFDDPTIPTPSATFPEGTTTVTLTVTRTDPTTQVAVSSTDTVDVTVSDDTPPTLSLVTNPVTLWPPNHKLRRIELIVLATDACDSSPEFVLDSVTSSEADNGSGSGNTTNDVQGVDAGTDDREFSLRAERDGSGSGRIYTVMGTVIDASGNSTHGTTQVVVPHDRGDARSSKAERSAKAAARSAEQAAKAARAVAKKAAQEAAKAARAAGKGRSGR
jgi:hypothetical protein